LRRFIVTILLFAAGLVTACTPPACDVPLELALHWGGLLYSQGLTCVAGDCGAELCCTGSFCPGDAVTLEAEATAEHHVVAWAGDCASAGAGRTCQLEMDGARSVDLSFPLSKVPVRVDVTNVSGGRGRIVSTPPGLDCETSCSSDFDYGTSLVLTAGGDAEDGLVGWSGACTGSALTCQLELTSEVQVGATFSPMNRVFVTSTSFSLPLTGGLAAADDACQALATAAGLPGTYVAWLSDPSHDAKDRLGTAEGWIRTDGRLFAPSTAGLVGLCNTSQLASGVRYPPSLDESGHAVAADALVVTGTTMFGEAGVAQIEGEEGTCDGWTATTGRALAGYAWSGCGMWTSGAGVACDGATAHLYCFGTDHRATTTRPAAQGRLAFVTAATYRGLGVADADGRCANEATAAGRSGSFRALLATTSATGISRFSTSGAPWVRPDGVAIVLQAADLAHGALLAPIALTAGGTSVGLWSGVRTGATTPDATGTFLDTCRDWSTTDPFLSFKAGEPLHANSEFFYRDAYNLPCNSPARYYCLEQ